MIPGGNKKQQWSPTEITAVMRHFSDNMTNRKLATVTGWQQCKTAEHPALAICTVQNTGDSDSNAVNVYV